MIDVNELRKGVTFDLDGELFRVLDYQHHKPGRGAATTRVKSRNLRKGTILEKSPVKKDNVEPKITISSDNKSDIVILF